MKKLALIGASGYAGLEFCRWVSHHPNLQITALLVSPQSVYLGQTIGQFCAELAHLGLPPLEASTDENIARLTTEVDGVVLATEHEVSANIIGKIVDSGVAIFDLSGGYRLKDPSLYERYYGFAHPRPDLLQSAAYGLAEWNAEAIASAQVVAVPGCYPTAAQLALKPLLAFAEQQGNTLSQPPVINAVSGVSGAGRKAKTGSHFCEVSLHPYGIFSHRHTPEIVQGVGTEVVFTPHLGAFKRGILATINVAFEQAVDQQALRGHFDSTYSNAPLVRLCHTPTPAIQAVEKTPFCDLGVYTQGNQVILVSAIDNLVKGAAGQALQCVNLHFGWPSETGMLPASKGE
ncbi:N-acetyl-gamma-glutamyl-phosphate reductase [bacterium SCSIO 12696]|nr:N-acetyl-gamma-glutamyl-phosphate reductase [bacterium SCSIO 12696]